MLATNTCTFRWKCLRIKQRYFGCQRQSIRDERLPKKSINQFIKSNRTKRIVYIAVKYRTCNDARPIINTCKHILLRVMHDMTQYFFLELQSAFWLISNHNSIRVLFHNIASVYFIFKNILIFYRRKWPVQGTGTVPSVLAHFRCLFATVSSPLFRYFISPPGGVKSVATSVCVLLYVGPSFRSHISKTVCPNRTVLHCYALSSDFMAHDIFASWHRNYVTVTL